MDEKQRLEFDMALAMREVRLSWRLGRDPLSLDDKMALSKTTIEGLGRARIHITVTREPGDQRGGF